MSEHDSTSAGRNELCPCGSGRKYKRCCQGKTFSRTNVADRKRWFNPFTVMIVITLVGALGVWGLAELARSGPSTPPDAGSSAASPAAPAGADSASPGTPQPTGPGATPEPWFYDEANNRHWDPGHNHWHDGPPPPEHLR